MANKKVARVRHGNLGESEALFLETLADRSWDVVTAAFVSNGMVSAGFVDKLMTLISLGYSFET